MENWNLNEIRQTIILSLGSLFLFLGCSSESFLSHEDPAPEEKSENKDSEAVSLDYERIREIMNTIVNDNQAQPVAAHYQFICDENERWIYRCNMLTGEIECFSMSSNKLRLLSSIK